MGVIVVERQATCLNTFGMSEWHIIITSITLNTEDLSLQSLPGRTSNSTHEWPKQVKAEREYLTPSGHEEELYRQGRRAGCKE